METSVILTLIVKGITTGVFSKAAQLSIDGILDYVKDQAALRGVNLTPEDRARI